MKAHSYSSAASMTNWWPRHAECLHVKDSTRARGGGARRCSTRLRSCGWPHALRSAQLCIHSPFRLTIHQRGECSAETLAFHAAWDCINALPKPRAGLALPCGAWATAGKRSLRAPWGEHRQRFSLLNWLRERSDEARSQRVVLSSVGHLATRVTLRPALLCSDHRQARCSAIARP